MILHALWEFRPSRHGYISRGPPSSLHHVCSSYAKDLLLSFTSQRLANYTHARLISVDNTLSLSLNALWESLWRWLILSFSNSLILSYLEYRNTCNLPLLCLLCLNRFIFVELLPDIHRRLGVLKGNRRRALSQETKVTWRTTKTLAEKVIEQLISMAAKRGNNKQDSWNWCSSRLYIRPYCV